MKPISKSSNAGKQTGVTDAPIQRATPDVAARPHRITIGLGLMSPLIACVAVWMALQSLNTSQRSMKVGQRAYLTYQVAVTNGKQVVDALHADKGFFLTYQITIANAGNTPEDSIYPKIGVVLDPDRTPVIVTFPSVDAFELGPKESRVLTGQALFKHFHNVSKLPGFSTGFNGQIEYKDVFEESQVKHVCYMFVVSGDSASAGMCGTVMQVLQIK